MTTTKRESRLERIAQHGRNLLAIFPGATEQDPVKLCKKLRRLEIKANELALRQCNGPAWPTEEAMEKDYDAVLGKVEAELGIGFAGRRWSVHINRDPRGYALKIDDEAMRQLFALGFRLHTDMGGYGIIAPEIK